MTRSVRSCCACLVGAISLALAAGGRADDLPLTGDWGGWRPKLADRGFTASLSYDGEVFANTRGGLETGATFEGMVTLGLDFDLDKMMHWSGATVHAAFYEIHGEGPTEKFVGDLGVLSSIDFADGARLFTLWFDQSFFDHKVDIRAGLLAIDDEFATTTYGGTLINSDFGTPAALSLGVPLASFPIAAPGVRINVQPVKWAYLLAGIFDGNPAPGIYPDPSPNAAHSTGYNHYGTQIALRHDEGALITAEMGLQFNQPDPGAKPSTGKDDAKQAKPPRGLASTYKVGFIYGTDTFSNIFDVTLRHLHSSLARAEARAADGNHFLYVQADQELWREPGSDTQGLAAFFRATFAPSDRNLMDRSLDAALHYTGLIPGRDADEMSVGLSWDSLSSSVAAATDASNHADHTRRALPDYEAVVEWTYALKANAWWKLQPDVQWIIHPGGSAEHSNALVVGLRSSFAF